jgi:hypothetical protein
MTKRRVMKMTTRTIFGSGSSRPPAGFSCYEDEAMLISLSPASKGGIIDLRASGKLRVKLGGCCRSLVPKTQVRLQGLKCGMEVDAVVG